MFWPLVWATIRGRGGGSDGDLVARVAAGERDALETLHERYYPRLYRLAYLKLGNADDAHDAASETFLRCVQHIQGLNPLQSSSLYPWLHRVAVNLITDTFRRRGDSSRVVLESEASEELSAYLEALEDGAPKPPEVLAQRQVQEAVRRAIAHLPQGQAEAVYYRFIGQMSIKQVAEEMGRSEGAIKSLLHRAIGSLRDRLREAAAQGRLRRLRQQGAQDVSGSSVRVHRRTPGGERGAD